MHAGELALFHPAVLDFYENLIGGESYKSLGDAMLPGLASSGVEVLVSLPCKDLSGKFIPFASYKYQKGDIPLVLHSIFEKIAYSKGNGYLISILGEWEFTPLRSQALDELLTDEIDLIRGSKGIPDRYQSKGSLEDTFRYLSAFPDLMRNHIGEIRVECALRKITNEELRQEQEHEDKRQQIEENEANVKSQVLHQAEKNVRT